jgi:hypothetical protein
MITDIEKAEIVRNVKERLTDLGNVIAINGDTGKSLRLIRHWIADPETNLFTRLYPGERTEYPGDDTRESK